MENKGLISVVVPVYNVAPYLRRCLDIVIGQTYSNLEILLIDDGSTDGSSEICDEYARADSRIRLVHKENGGISSVRNLALDLATGEYIAFFDSDDYAEKSMLQIMYDQLRRSQSDIVICSHYTEYDGELRQDEPPISHTTEYTPQEALELLVEDQVLRSYLWDKLYKRSLFEGLRYPDGKNYEDLAIIYRLFERCERITHIPDYLYYYQVRKGSLSSRAGDDEKWYANIGAMTTAYHTMYDFFVTKGNTRVAEIALSKLIPYIYTYENLTYRHGEFSRADIWRRFVRTHRSEININPRISGKDKKLALIYGAPAWLVKLFIRLK